MQGTAETGSAPGQMSRRSVLRGAAGVGAAGLAATALASPAIAASRTRKPARKPQSAAEPTAADLTASEAVVVHVRDLRTGQLDVYRGTSHVRIHDRGLAAQLARASQ
jgi:hypothetical protein